MKTLIVCTNQRANPNVPSCGMRGGIELAELAEKECQRLALDVRVGRFKCLGLCEHGPNLKIVPEGHFIHGASETELLSLLRTAGQDQA